MTRNVFRYYKRLIGPVVTTTLVLLAAAGTAWGQPSEVTKLLASDAAAEDEFGFCVSISGDTAVVGAPFHDHLAGSNSGSAYIVQQDPADPDTWDEIKELIAQDAFVGDLFGFSVAISGDVAIVGARRDDDGGINAGSAYIFRRDQGGIDQWGQWSKVTASDAAAGDHFGWSVSISGEVAIVGAADATNGTGAAYIFIPAEADQWEQVAKLTASDGVNNDNFGYSVSISGDTVIIGAPGDLFSGSLYIFNKPPGGWQSTNQEDAKLIAATLFLGWSVSISADTAIAGGARRQQLLGRGVHLRTQRRRAGGVGPSGQAHRVGRCVG